MTKFAGRLANVSGARLGSIASGAFANEQETSNSVCCSQERVVKEFETLTYAAELPSTPAYAPALQDSSKDNMVFNYLHMKNWGGDCLCHPVVRRR